MKTDFHLDYSERLDTKWIMTSEEFIEGAVQNKTGKNAGARSVWFNGKERDTTTGTYNEHVHERFKGYVAHDFTRIANPTE